MTESHLYSVLSFASHWNFGWNSYPNFLFDRTASGTPTRVVPNYITFMARKACDYLVQGIILSANVESLLE